MITHNKETIMQTILTTICFIVLKYLYSLVFVVPFCSIKSWIIDKTDGEPEATTVTVHAHVARNEGQVPRSL